MNSTLNIVHTYVPTQPFRREPKVPRSEGGRGSQPGATATVKSCGSCGLKTCGSHYRLDYRVLVMSESDSALNQQVMWFLITANDCPNKTNSVCHRLRRKEGRWGDCGPEERGSGMHTRTLGPQLARGGNHDVQHKTSFKQHIIIRIGFL